jgi:hypothetical protein
LRRHRGEADGQFNTKAGEYDLSPRRFMGKKLYEKSELSGAIHASGGWKSKVGAGALPSIALRRLRWRRHWPDCGYDQRRGKR